MIGVASDMMDYRIKGAGWILASAILLVLLSVLIVFNPIIGAGLVVVWIGVSLIVLGIAMIAFSIYLNKLRRRLP